MNYDEIWSFPFDQIDAYLMERGAVKKENTYMIGECCIKIEALSQRPVGNTLSLPQTRVQMKGAGADTVHRGFHMHFLSGGA